MSKTRGMKELEASSWLHASRDSLLALYWSDSDGAKDFHRIQAIRSLRIASEALGFDLVEASKAEAA